jgi:hypothetical protein
MISHGNLKINYGLICLHADFMDEGGNAEVLHFCGFQNKPTDSDIEFLREELREDKDFGLSDIVDELIIVDAPEEVLSYYKELAEGISTDIIKTMEDLQNLFISVDLLDERDVYYDVIIDILFTEVMNTYGSYDIILNSEQNIFLILSTKYNLKGSYRITDKNQMIYLLDRLMDYCIEKEYFEKCSNIKRIKDSIN